MGCTKPDDALCEDQDSELGDYSTELDHIRFNPKESVPAGVGAVTTAPGTYGFAALFLLSGAMELAVWTQATLCGGGLDWQYFPFTG